MELLGKLNNYFGESYSSISEFTDDLLYGELGKIYSDDQSKLISVLGFLGEMDDY